MAAAWTSDEVVAEERSAVSTTTGGAEDVTLVFGAEGSVTGTDGTGLDYRDRPESRRGFVFGQ